MPLGAFYATQRGNRSGLSYSSWDPQRAIKHRVSRNYWTTLHSVADNNNGNWENDIVR